ncbi:hypothetical protein Pelo_19906 [Pelomyxa schiedti]|nr:hypothetical protein Pelo_19906 [Pelomyxa schiedti]
MVEATVGDDRFLVTDTQQCPSVIDSSGKVVAALSNDGDPSVFGRWVYNRKWLVRVDTRSEGTRFIVWRMNGNGSPVSGRGVDVACTERIHGMCARLSPFNPWGDELVIVTVEH